MTYITKQNISKTLKNRADKTDKTKTLFFSKKQKLDTKIQKINHTLLEKLLSAFLISIFSFGALFVFFRHYFLYKIIPVIKNIK